MLNRKRLQEEEKKLILHHYRKIPYHFWISDRQITQTKKTPTTSSFRHERLVIGLAGSNQRITGSKPVALPLGYSPIKMEGSGFEPPNPKERIYSPPRLARLRYPSETEFAIKPTNIIIQNFPGSVKRII